MGFAGTNSANWRAALGPFRWTLPGGRPLPFRQGLLAAVCRAALLAGC